ncbi:MAG: 1-acyl-sn-glycerol-3-phosphate acyltransferase [Leptospiraceae bacterium]
MSTSTATHPGKTRIASALLSLAGAVLLRILFRQEYSLPASAQTTGPVLILAKHRQELDILLGYRGMLKAFRRHAWCIMKASLARKRYLGFFYRIGGIPLDRDKPEKSRNYLKFARKVLFERNPGGLNPGSGNMMVLFPEQTVYPENMGEGKVAGFRFLAGKPPESSPLTVYCAGIEYLKGFPRGRAILRFSEPRSFSAKDRPEVFLHDCMVEIARLSNLSYSFPAPGSPAVMIDSSGGKN